MTVDKKYGLIILKKVSKIQLLIEVSKILKKCMLSKKVSKIQSHEEH